MKAFSVRPSEKEKGSKKVERSETNLHKHGESIFTLPEITSKFLDKQKKGEI